MSKDTVVDVHPARPDYRGFALGEKIISLEADPSFEELEAAGAIVSKHDETHTVLDNMFLISGEIPRLTPYETGLKGAMRYDLYEKDWFSDESITDERFLMCKLKGRCLRIAHRMLILSCRERNRHVHRVQPRRCGQLRQTRSQPLRRCSSSCYHWRFPPRDK